jgi:hypothetical protein
LLQVIFTVELNPEVIPLDLSVGSRKRPRSAPSAPPPEEDAEYLQPMNIRPPSWYPNLSDLRSARHLGASPNIQRIESLTLVYPEMIQPLDPQEFDDFVNMLTGTF